MKKFFSRSIALMMLTVMMCFSVSTDLQAQEGFSYEFEKNCKALYMFSLDDGSVVYSMNADEVLPMASLTKIMTYIVASENIPDIENTVVTVPERIGSDLAGTNSSLAGVNPGEELTVLQLLNMMMIPSGNDASLALQYYYDENIAGVAAGADSAESPFIALMNEKAEELGCTDTHFVNPHGLHDGDHHSTARDIGKIVQYAVTLPHFKEITSTTVYTLPATNVYPEEREINATNKMLLPDYEDGMYYYEYADGIKTGSHNEAGYCIAASATYEDRTYVVVALGSPMITDSGEYVSKNGAMLDAAALFDWGFNQLSEQTLNSAGDVLGITELKDAWQDTIRAVAVNDVSVILPNDTGESELETVVDLPKIVETPVEEGDIIGKVTYLYNGEQVGESELAAAESVEKSIIVQIIEFCKVMVTSAWFWIVFVVIVVLIGYIVFMNHRRKKRRRRRRRRSGQKSGTRNGHRRSSQQSGRVQRK